MREKKSNIIKRRTTLVIYVFLNLGKYLYFVFIHLLNIINYYKIVNNINFYTDPYYEFLCVYSYMNYPLSHLNVYLNFSYHDLLLMNCVIFISYDIYLETVIITCILK